MDGTLLQPEVILRKILDRLNEPCAVDAEAVTLISDATEHRLLEVLNELSTLAEHRRKPLSQHPAYCTVDNTKEQLKFIEANDGRKDTERKAKELQELMHFTKNKKQKLEYEASMKELQNNTLETERQNQADETLAALGGSKPLWGEQPKSAVPLRPRTVRISIGDLQALAGHDPLLIRECYNSVPLRSNLMTRLTLGN